MIKRLGELGLSSFKISAKASIYCIFALFGTWVGAPPLQAETQKEINSKTIPARPTIKFAYMDFPPFSYKNDEGQDSGYFYLALKSVLVERLGYEIVGIQMPWKRVQNEVQQGNVDIMLTVATKERLEYAVASTSPVFDIQMKLFTYAQHPLLKHIHNVKSAEDILNLGLTSVTNLGNGWHKEKITDKGVHTVFAGGDDNSLAMLAEKRVDILIDSSSSTGLHIQNMRLEQSIVETDAILETINMRLLMSKKSSHLAVFEEIDTTITELFQAGSFSPAQLPQPGTTEPD